MFTTRRINHPGIVCALACALLTFAMSGTAAAIPHQHTKASAARAQARYYSSYGEPAQSKAWTPTKTQIQSARAQARYYSSYGEPAQSKAWTPTKTQIQSARAQARYYSSYGEPTPLVAPQPPAPSDDTPWLPIALAGAAALAIAAASATRLRIRRGRATQVGT